MGKGGKPKIEVTEYFMSEHFGICIGPVTLLEIVIKEKSAWSGEVTELASFEISNPELFGGVKKEGGVQGVVTYLPGDDDQVMPDGLAMKLGRANGLDCPGFRGIASLFFTGTDSTIIGNLPGLVLTKLKGGLGRGFYWTANTPYLPGVWTKVRREPIGLNPAYALIDTAGTADQFPYEVYPTDITQPWRLWGFTFSPDYSRFGWGYQIYEIWDNEKRQRVRSGEWPVEVDLQISYGVYNDGQILAMGSQFPDDTADQTLWRIDGDTAVAIATFPDSNQLQEGVRLIADGDDNLHWMTIPWSINKKFYVDGTEYTGLALTGINWKPMAYFPGPDGSIWTVGRLTSLSADTAYLYRVVAGSHTGPNFLSVTGLPAMQSQLGDLSACYAAGAFVIAWNTIGNGEWLYRVDPADGSILDSRSGVSLDEYNFEKQFNNLPPGSTSIWLENTEIDLLTLDTIQTVDLTDWSTTDDASGIIYDPLNNALITAPQFDQEIAWRFLGPRLGQDANPAHIIYECLTNTDWGMGSPTTAIDYDSFDAASQVLYDEVFGLSLLWTRQSTIQDFIQEILDHIQAVLYVDPATGLLTLSLIRGDYDPELLDELTPDNADLSSFSRKLWGDIVNEIIVTWTNPVNEQEETIAVQDDASIAIQGGVVSDSRNYYGVRSATLAQQLAMRDLRSAGQPLAVIEAEVDRSQWDLRPASVIKVTWPEYGLSEIVMRVQSIDYGKLGDPMIKLSLIEDVYGLDIGTYDAPPSSSWTDPTADPEPLSPVEIITLPYFFAGQTTVAAYVESPEYPEVLAGILATSENDDGFEYEVWDEVTLANGTTEWRSIATNNILGHAELAAALDAEATTADVSFDNLIGRTYPKAAGFVIIGDAGETGNEIAMINSDSGGVYDLVRGVLDTIPRAWPMGTPVWFVDDSTIFEDTLVRSSGEVVDYKLLMRTSQGMLPLYDASPESQTLSDRPWLPNRPANVIAYGEAWSSADAPIDARGRADPWVTVSWAIRNRLEEDSQILAWTDATQTAETGQTTTIEIRAADGTLITTHDGLTGTTFDVPDSSFGSAGLCRIRVYSERSDDDGDFVSLQYFEHWIIVDPTRFDSTYVTFDSTYLKMDQD